MEENRGREKTVRIAVVQTNPVFGRVEENISTTIGLMESESADLFVLPELFATGYHFADRAEASAFSEPPEGPTFARISSFARARTCFVCYGFAERSDSVYNSAALVGPGGLIGLYRKTHLFARETMLFTGGDLGFPVFDLPFGRVGMMICFDWIYPESARTLALRGAQVILHPSNLVTPYCPDAMITRCLENRVFAATANRVGTDDRPHGNLRFIGCSEIVTPRGIVLKRLGDAQAAIAAADIDPAQALDKQFNEFNNLLADRRERFYFRTSREPS
jgi:5-aminopentanamidase